MEYVEVLVGDATYHGDEPLTYCASTPLAAGQLVHVPLRRKEILGVVVGGTVKPTFNVKAAGEVLGAPLLPAPLLSLLEWMRNYYPAPLGITTQLFLPKALPKKPVEVTTLLPPSVASLPPLTGEQAQALAKIQSPGLHILHGETGTGKTRIYIELAHRALVEGKSSIILTPEIGLTSQLANNFRAVFGDRVLLMHSGLTDVTRQRGWLQMLHQDQPIIVIGARSALFSPIKKVGLIVIDESHETAYKQDQAPYYHATSVAAKLAALHDATLLLGSATPLVRDYYVATAKKRPIIRMSQSAITSEFSEKTVHVVDLRERSSFTKSSFISNQLIKAVDQTLAEGGQTLLFLNRRGTARVIMCDKCGWQAACPHCDLPLVYHGDSHLMRCHSCDYKTASPVSCPVCRNASVVFKSIGTKAVADEAARLFPSARIQRFDTDNKKSERIDQHYDAVRAGGVDIIVGTQTLAKGLDLPKLSLVGVIIADTSLYFPDFSAEERTYELLSQVLGRVGRGHRLGQAVIQTYAPDSPLLKAVLTKDWDTFYNKEIAERQLYRFPPFCYLLKLTCRRATSASAQKAATLFVEELHIVYKNLVIEGPAPSFHEKVQNKFVWQVVVKAKNRAALLSVIRQLPAGWSYDIDPMNVL